jgi:uncharacterized cupin superfamily protein
MEGAILSTANVPVCENDSIETIEVQLKKGGKNMSDIKVESHPDQERLNELGIFDWAIWKKEASEFPWFYDEQETCYLLEGDVVVTPDGGEPVEIKKGDLVTFPKGMSCTWNIRSDVRKHYRFE